MFSSMQTLLESHILTNKGSTKPCDAVHPMGDLATVPMRGNNKGLWATLALAGRKAGVRLDIA